MSGIDLAVLTVIAVSALVGRVRGFSEELVGLATRLGAIAITLPFTARFVHRRLPPEIGQHFDLRRVDV